MPDFWNCMFLVNLIKFDYIFILFPTDRKEERQSPVQNWSL
jgi:hypothetical protein